MKQQGKAPGSKAMKQGKAPSSKAMKQQGKAPGSKAMKKQGKALGSQASKQQGKAKDDMAIGSEGAASSTPAPEVKPATVMPQHRHHFKTWFFQGRPGMTLSAIQIDIQAGAVHETWSRTE